MIKSILIFILFIALEIPKRILSPIIYPTAYILRNKIRNKKVVVWKEYLYGVRRGLHTAILWMFLDDSIFMEQGQDYNAKKTCYPKWLWTFANWLWELEWPLLRYVNSSIAHFLLSWWWSAWRNSCVNWNNWNAWKLGKFEKILKSWGEESFLVLYDKRKGYRLELRKFTNGERFYLEVYLFKRWYQFGCLDGTATRFEIDLWKDR